MKKSNTQEPVHSKDASGSQQAQVAPEISDGDWLEISNGDQSKASEAIHILGVKILTGWPLTRRERYRLASALINFKKQKGLERLSVHFFGCGRPGRPPVGVDKRLEFFFAVEDERHRVKQDDIQPGKRKKSKGRHEGNLADVIAKVSERFHKSEATGERWYRIISEYHESAEKNMKKDRSIHDTGIAQLIP